MLKADSFSESIKPIILFAKIFGLAPIKFNKTKMSTAKLSLFLSIVLIIILTLYSVFILLENRSSNYGFIMKIWDYVTVYINLGSMCLMVLRNCLRRTDVSFKF